MKYAKKPTACLRKALGKLQDAESGGEQEVPGAKVILSISGNALRVSFNKRNKKARKKATR